MTKQISRHELNEMVKSGTIRHHHTAYFRGYVSRTGGPSPATVYAGKFGEGFVTVQPNWNSTQYSFVTYYIFT